MSQNRKLKGKSETEELSNKRFQSQAEEENLWRRLEFSEYRKRVEKIQQKIYKVKKENSYRSKRKMRILQYMLINSRENKILAVQKVTTNNGKNELFIQIKK